MALMVGSLYEALKSAGVDDDRARMAAEEVADHSISALDHKVSALDGRVTLLISMLGCNLAISAVLFWLIFSLSGTTAGLK
jgi:hypothetical protein